MTEKKFFCAGAAKGEITPSKELMPMPFVWTIEFTEVMDPIYVRVLFMTEGGRKSLFIALEMTVVPYAGELLKFVADHTGIDKEYIFITATHTHEAPPIGYIPYAPGSAEEQKCRRWFEEIKKTLLHTICEAQESARPARVGYGTGKSYININRDEICGDRAVIGNNFERASDKTVKLVRIEDMDGAVIALIVNYAVHAVVMNGCLIDNAVHITGDLPGRTSAKLEQELNGAVVLWTSGAAGDQNPRIMTQYGGFGTPENPVYKNLEKNGYIILEFLACEHTRDILAANRTFECTQIPEDIFGAQSIAMCRGKEQPEVSYILRILTVGDIVFQGISAEIVTSIGAAVREVSPYSKTILCSHCMDYMGYVPDDWEYDHNAFEVDGSKTVKGEAVPAFQKGFRELFAKMESK